ncbi:uncharacterized protein WM277_007928 [Molossus nigricans]
MYSRERPGHGQSSGGAEGRSAALGARQDRRGQGPCAANEGELRRAGVERVTEKRARTQGRPGERAGALERWARGRESRGRALAQRKREGTAAPERAHRGVGPGSRRGRRESPADPESGGGGALRAAQGKGPDAGRARPARWEQGRGAPRERRERPRAGNAARLPAQVARVEVLETWVGKSRTSAHKCRRRQGGKPPSPRQKFSRAGESVHPGRWKEVEAGPGEARSGPSTTTSAEEAQLVEGRVPKARERMHDLPCVPGGSPSLTVKSKAAFRPLILEPLFCSVLSLLTAGKCLVYSLVHYLLSVSPTRR